MVEAMNEWQRNTPYGCIYPQTFSGPRLSILRLQQEELRRQFHYDFEAKDLDAICSQRDGALSVYRKKREWFGENSYNRKALESLWEVSVEIAREERRQSAIETESPHWLNWNRHEWPCVY